jgi:hypothetical protein
MLSRGLESRWGALVHKAFVAVAITVHRQGICAVFVLEVDINDCQQKSY